MPWAMRKQHTLCAHVGSCSRAMRQLASCYALKNMAGLAVVVRMFNFQFEGLRCRRFETITAVRCSETIP